MEVPRHRPFGVTVLAVLAGIAFVVNAFVTLLFLGALPVALFGGTGFFGQALVGAFFWGLLAFIWGWVTIGLWNMDPQAWLFVVIVTMLNLILAGISVLGATTWQAVLPSLLLNAVILIYSLSPGVKQAFGVPEQRV